MNCCILLGYRKSENGSLTFEAEVAVANFPFFLSTCGERGRECRVKLKNHVPPLHWMIRVLKALRDGKKWSVLRERLKMTAKTKKWRGEGSKCGSRFS